MKPNPLRSAAVPGFAGRNLLRCLVAPRLRGASLPETRTASLNGMALFLLALLLSSCASTGGQVAVDTPAFVIVRHAEKADDGSKDPPLTAAGEARANRLAATLRGTSLQAVYATAYRRTQATAMPAASLHRLSVITYDAQLPAIEFARRLRRDHLRGTVLIVGHSNTAPSIAAALCGCEVRAMGDQEYDRRMVIRFDAGGHATFEEERY